MARNPTDLLWCCGWRTTGDLGPLTCYWSTRGYLVFYDKAPPLSPASPRQIMQQHKWSAAARAWRAIPKEDKEKWSTAARKAHLQVTGYNLWVYWVSTRDRATIATVERQSAITLLP